MSPYYLYLAAVTLPNLAVFVRRMHDTSKSAWYLLIALIPIAGPILVLIRLCSEGDRGQNAYGPDPKLAENAPYLATPPAHS